MEVIYKPPTDTFDQLFSAWRSLPCQTHSYIPAKSSFNPMKVPEILPFLVMLKDRGDGIAQYILMGNQVQEMYGLNLTGKTTAEIAGAVTPHILFHRALVKGLVDRQCGSIAVRQISDVSGEDWAFNVLSLPLTGETGTVEYFILACVLQPPEEVLSSYQGDTWTRSRSFRIQDTTLKFVTFLDLGGGVPDLTADKPEDITIRPAIGLRGRTKLPYRQALGTSK